jgi:sugar phosphate isomerase/epimerase
MSEQISRRGFVGSALGIAAGFTGCSQQGRAIEVSQPAVSAAGPVANLPRKFRLGLVTYNFAPQWDLKTLLKRCREAGYEGVEPRTTHKHGVEPTLSKEQRADVRKQFADAGITLWCLGTVCEFHSPDPAVVQKNIDDCKRWTDLAHDLGAHCVKVRPNGLPKEVEEARTLEQIGRSLRACAEAAGGIEIVCEVHGYDTAEPRRMRRIMDVANHPLVGVTWNSNGSDLKNGSVKGSFELLRPFVKSCHINDLLSGYPYRELFTLFREAGYDRWTEMEFNPPLESTSDRDNVLFMKYYKGVWNELSKA